MRLIVFIIVLPGIMLSSSVAQEVVMQINADDDVHYVVTDPLGRRTGIDPRGAIARKEWKRFNEIPNTNYASMSVGNLDPNGSVEVSMEFVYHFNSPQYDGTYKIQVFGNKLSTFDLHVSADGDPPLQRADFAGTQIPIDKDSAIIYLFTYHGAPGSPVSLVKIVSGRSLIQDLAAMRKLNWITDQPTADKYANLITSYNHQLQQRDFNGAKTTLNSVIQNFVSDSSRTVSNDAYKSLRADIVQLLSQLPTPPPAYTLTLNILDSGTVTKTPDQTSYDSASRVQLKATPSIWYSTFSGWSRDAGGSTNPLFVTMNSNKTITAAFSLIPVSAMIDTLMAFKHQAQSKGWIGDANFVKELDNGLENARKHLAKRDSVNCGKELEDLQKKVKKEFEKESRKDKRFVTEDGYTLLYFSAQHIIGRLPRKK